MALCCVVWRCFVLRGVVLCSMLWCCVLCCVQSARPTSSTIILKNAENCAVLMKCIAKDFPITSWSVGGVEVQLQSFLTSALDVVSDSLTGRNTPGKETPTSTEYKDQWV